MPSRFALLALLVLISTSLLAQEREYYVASPHRNLPFSSGVLVGDTLYIAGHLGLDPQTGKPPSDAEVEARLVMDAIKKVVEKFDMTMDDIVMIEVHCTDLDLYGTFNKVYRTYFQGAFPARAFLGSAMLLRDARFEVLGIAVKKKLP
ncbi:MAG: RidA family protein [Betaproteobacteria bacterium]|nr:MAG: RidA family protein [Betaproteobacteria bacterium]